MRDWPDDPDGEVFRSLAAQGFDFSKPYEIDFNVDFTSRLIDQGVFSAIRHTYPDARILNNTGQDLPYIQVKLFSVLSYKFVLKTQEILTGLSRQFGGRCDS